MYMTPYWMSLDVIYHRRNNNKRKRYNNRLILIRLNERDPKLLMGNNSELFL